jgi:hypothetical protein
VRRGRPEGRPLRVEEKHVADDKRRGGKRPYGDDRRGGGNDRRGSGGDRRGGGRDGRRDDGPRQGGGGRPSHSNGGERRPTRGAITVGDEPGAELPKWIRDEVRLSTAKERVQPTLALLQDAAYGFAAGKYRQIAPKLEEAKKLSSRAATIRELLGLTYYRLERWEDALREMRAFRRLAGETTHMAIELDCLRALGRREDVDKTWALLRELGADGQAKSEAKVVYASFLLEQGEPGRAWKVVQPGRLHAEAPEHVVREWYVAARAAAAVGDAEAALKLARAIEKRDVAFPGLEELYGEIG